MRARYKISLKGHTTRYKNFEKGTFRTFKGTKSPVQNFSDLFLKSKRAVLWENIETTKYKFLGLCASKKGQGTSHLYLVNMLKYALVWNCN
jgi:hypothetical protein